MGQAEFKEKLGDRGHITGKKTFNKESGVSGDNKSSPQTTWHGTTKGGMTHKKGS